MSKSAMSRKQFMQSKGATCDNWAWSWSFINAAENTVIFGAWDSNTKGSKSLIFRESWATGSNGRKKSGYSQSREHIRLVEEEGYKLFTFPIIFSDELKDERGIGPAKIKGFKPVLTMKSLIRSGVSWYAFDEEVLPGLGEEVSNSTEFVEGAVKTVTFNAYERNDKARLACIKHHGVVCAACHFSFEEIYGPIGKGFIHVHHIVPLAKIRRVYKLDPIRDLIPVCPNCHAMIHSTEPAMSIDELKATLRG